MKNIEDANKKQLGGKLIMKTNSVPIRKAQSGLTTMAINYGPAGTRDLVPCIGEKLSWDITNPADEVKILLVLNGNMSIYDGEIRWN